MNLDCQTNIYKGNYGGLDTGILVHAQLTVPPGPQPSSQNREIILVVDLSGSMHKDLPYLQASLRAFRDFMCEKCTSDQGVPFRLIGYNEDAKELYSGTFGNQKSLFDKAVAGLAAEGRTNMGAGLELAFEKSNPRKATWVVVLSDGVSNKGAYQSPEAFSKLTARRPLHTRIVSVGYGQNFDADIMQAVGDFTYIRDPEIIPVFFGNLAQEVISTVAFGTTISANFLSRVVIGSYNLGCLYPERKCVYGVVPVDKLTEKAGITLSFWILGNPMKFVTIPMKLEYPQSLEEPPDEVKEDYYRFAAMRRLRLLYSSLRARNLANKITLIKKSLDKWVDPCAREAKAEVLRYISELESGCNLKLLGYEVAGISNDIQRQYTTLSQTEGAQRTYTAYQGYL